MASKYTKIPRSINEFKFFLDYNHFQYKDAYDNIQPDKGWNVPYYSSEFFRLVDTMYLNLYDSIYPKLTPDDPSPDEQILDTFKSILEYFSNANSLFDRIVDAREKQERVRILKTVEGIVQDLLLRAVYKLREVIQIGNEDLIASATLSQPNNISETGKLYTVSIITATSEEFNEVRKLLPNPQMLPTIAEDSQVYYEDTLNTDHGEIKIILTQCHHQGIAAASTTTTKMILRFKPDIVAMLGHCAGNKKLIGKLNLGDILICTEAIDYEQVTVLEKNSDGKPEIREKDRKVPVAADTTIIKLLEDLAANSNNLAQIKSEAPGEQLYKHAIGWKSGKIISGDALVRSEKWFEKVIGDNTGAIGLDMETYGVYYASEHTTFKNKPLFISIKSVSDYGSHRKDFPTGLEDNSVRVPYAINVSAKFFFNFCIKHLPL
jgi:nucleoside phosphorylase